MTQARKWLVDNSAPAFYHCTNRCVRRAFLCGVDEETGSDYSHRKVWLENRMKALSEAFAVDIYAYAIMSNHYHVVLYVEPLAPLSWSDEEIADRWLVAFPSKDCEKKRAQRKQKILNSNDRLATLRKRLGRLSWFMSCLNTPLAKLSNLEDECTGKFWEKRYTSQALLDEGAIFSCMTYVDLNPVRARITEKLEESDFTSVQHRIQQQRLNPIINQAIKAVTGSVNSDITHMPLTDYLQLVEWTGQAIVHPDKAAIPANITPILDRLNLQQHHWLKHITQFHKHYIHAVGSIERVRQFAEQLKRRCFRGIQAAQVFYQ